jgi:hypothetical protein
MMQQAERAFGAARFIVRRGHRRHKLSGRGNLRQDSPRPPPGGAPQSRRRDRVRDGSSRNCAALHLGNTRPAGQLTGQGRHRMMGA